MTDEIYIRTKTDAMKCIGKMVYWDDPGSRWIFLRQGILEEYQNRQVFIDGGWHSIRSLTGLRNFKGKRWE